jgi:hypothetical protein
MGQALLPFAAGTRLRRQYVGSVRSRRIRAHASLQLPRVGMLSRLYVILDGTLTLSGAGAFADKGPHNIIKRIQLNTNIGSAAIIDVSGYGGAMQSAAFTARLQERRGWRRRHYAVLDLLQREHCGHGRAPLAVGVQRRAESGAELHRWPSEPSGAGSDGVRRPSVRRTDGRGFDGNGVCGFAYVYYEYFEIPDPRAFEMPRLALHRTLEEQIPVSQTGAMIYTLPRMGTLLSMDSILTLNGARSDSWDSFAVRFNKTDSVYQVDQRWQRIDERYWLGIEPDVGVIRLDLFHAQEALNAGTSRDAIDTEQLTTLENIVNISAGATLGASNNSLAVVRRVVQILD